MECARIAYVQLNPPTEITSSQFLDPITSSFRGYLTNPNATTDCNFCSVYNYDAFLAVRFNIFYSRAWCNFGFMMVLVFFNVRLLCSESHI